MNSGREKRLGILREVPFLAQLDHRLFQDQNGGHPALEMGTRKERRLREKAAKKLAERYHRHLLSLRDSGAKFPVDQFLRQLAMEYTHRYAGSGTRTQPTSFNYFEPFLNIKFFPESIAPHVTLCSEYNHLFSSVDFFDYLTGTGANTFDVVSLMGLREAEILHFTINGHILDLTFLGPGEREFALSGFSLVRRGSSVHWFMVGGRLFTADEWKELQSQDEEVEIQNVPVWKRAFMRDVLEQNGDKAGCAVALEGTTLAAKTILCGEFDVTVSKHLARCIMFEAENSFHLFCDDPEVVTAVEDARKEEITGEMMEQIGAAGTMWNLAEALLQLPHYFAHRVPIADEVVKKAGKRVSGLKGGDGPGARFRIVPALEVQKVGSIVREVRPPHYLTETEGHWRKLANDAIGQDRNGNPIKGKTWVQQSSKWKELHPEIPVVYVKDRIASAKLKAEEIMDLAAAAGKRPPEYGVVPKHALPELYILRCSVMESEVYKVGWTSGTAESRAMQLSSETGVPVAFVVARSWAHANARALEAEAHAMLAPYRINDRREFFRAPLQVLEEIIEGVFHRAAQRN